MSVSIDSMAAEIIKSLQRYGEAVSEDVDAAAETAAKHAKQKLNERSPVGKTGSYRKGWTIKREKRAKTGGQAAVAVWNKTDYRLTHLLETPHARVDWGRRTGLQSTPIPHIAQVQEETAAEFEELVKKAVQQG